MKRYWLSVLQSLVYGTLMFACAQPAGALCIRNTHVRPADIVSDDVSHLFKEKNYKKLDELATTYETELTATFDQVSALSAFYRGIEQEFNSCSTVRTTEEDWTAHRDAIVAWSAASPNSKAAKLALALFTIDYAWRARGTGYASETNDDAMSLYKQRLEEARIQFERLANVNKRNPAWYSGMLVIAMGQGWKPEKVDAMYVKAASIDPYYLDIHYTITEFFTPRWYGSDKQMHDAIDRASRLTNKRMGKTMYTRLHWTQSTDTNMFTSGSVDWGDMKTGFEDFLKLFPDIRVRNNFADFACLAKDIETLKKQLALLGDQVNPNMWASVAFFEYCSDRVKDSANSTLRQ